MRESRVVQHLLRTRLAFDSVTLRRYEILLRILGAMLIDLIV